MTSWDRWTVSARLYGALGLGAVVVLGALGMGYAQMRRGEALLSAITTNVTAIKEVGDELAEGAREEQQESRRLQEQAADLNEKVARFVL